MILTGPRIHDEVAAGRIVIDPYDPGMLNPNSYNFTLGPQIAWTDTLVDPHEHVVYERFDLREPPYGTEGLLLVPGRLYLGETSERIGSPVHATSLIGRSTMGRLGLWLQVSSDLGHAGACNRWTLEMRVVQPLRVRGGETLGQVSFWEVAGTPMAYEGVYADQAGMRVSALLPEAA